MTARVHGLPAMPHVQPELLAIRLQRSHLVVASMQMSKEEKTEALRALADRCSESHANQQVSGFWAAVVYNWLPLICSFAANQGVPTCRKG